MNEDDKQIKIEKIRSIIKDGNLQDLKKIFPK